MMEYPLGIGGGLLTRVLEQGDGETAIVCIHGVGSRADRFRRCMPGLAARGYRVIAVDLPGHGFASKGAADYSVAYWSRAVLDSCDALGLEHFVLCGQSLGGQIAAHMTCAWPDRVRALLMLGSLGIVPLGSDSRNAIADSIMDRSLDGIARKLRYVFHQQDLISPEWEREEYRINNSPGAAEAFECISRYFREHIDEDVVGARLNSEAPAVPRLLLWGAEDRMVVPGVGIAAQEVLRDTPLVLMRDCGHGPYYERPESFCSVVHDFLTGRIQGRVTQTI